MSTPKRNYMIYFLLLMMFLGCAAPAAAAAAPPNLLLNPGFEEGVVGWSAPWAREPAAITAQVNAAAAHSGTAGLRVVYRGEKDWSWEQAAPVKVKPGDIIHLGGWLRTEKVVGDVSLSVVLRNAAGSALSWIYEPAITGNVHDWQYFERRFVIPTGSASITFRVTGDGPCVVEADDLLLAREGSVEDARKQSHFAGLELTGRLLHVHVGDDLSMDIRDLRAGRTWTAEAPALPWIVRDARTTGNRVELHVRDVLSNVELQVRLELVGSEMEVSITGPPGATVGNELLFPSALASRPGDFVVIPLAEGIIVPVEDLQQQRSFHYADYKTTMAWCGVTDLKTGYMILPQTPADAGILIRPVGSGSKPLLGLQPAWDGEKGKWGYTRRATYAFFDKGGYVAMAQRYRKWAEKAGYVKPFREKQKARPAIDRLIGAVDLWGQFDPAWYRQLREMGVDRAICSLGGGWKGPTGIASLVKELNSVGYLPSHYDIYTDVWPARADDEPRGARKYGYPEDVYVNADGSFAKGWVIKEGNVSYQGYYICATQQSKEAIPRISADLKENPYTCRFIDVITAAGPRECYSPVHPATRSQDIAAKHDMLGLVSGQFGLVTGSEECRDWAMNVADYGEGTMTIRASSNAGYDWTQPTKPDDEYLRQNDARYRLPLHALTFHDCHVATWYTGDGGPKVPDSWLQKDLLNILYGSMPLWSLNRELWATYRKDALCSYYRVSPVFRATGYNRMTSHRFLTADRRAQETQFAGGVKVIVNFGPEPFDLPPSASPTKASLRLPAFGYAVTGPGLMGYRAEVGGQVIETVESADHALVVSPTSIAGGGAVSGQGIILAGRGLKSRFVAVLEGNGPVEVRARGPLAGIDLATARLVGLNDKGQEVEPRTLRTPGKLSFQPLPGIERYEIR